MSVRLIAISRPVEGLGIDSSGDLALACRAVLLEQFPTLAEVLP